MGRKKNHSMDSDSVERAQYANCFKVGHNAFEFLIDFGQLHPEKDEEQIHTRIITNPAHAKVLSDILLESIHRFEASYGAIGR